MKTLSFAALLGLLCASSALADGLHVTDPYARVIAGNGVVYFRISNDQDSDDTLLAAKSDIGMAMLMTSSEDANGVMQMRMVMDGFAVPAHGTHLLTNASDHVMLSDLASKPKPGDTLTLTLTFATAGDVVLTVPVDNARRTDPGPGPTEHDAASPPK
jgi:copper(I)-binding protein